MSFVISVTSARYSHPMTTMTNENNAGNATEYGAGHSDQWCSWLETRTKDENYLGTKTFVTAPPSGVQLFAPLRSTFCCFPPNKSASAEHPSPKRLDGANGQTAC